MKTLCGLFIILGVSLFSSALSAQDIDSTYSLRGIKFGDSPSKYKSLSQVKDKESDYGIKEYIPSDFSTPEAVKIGDAYVDEIRYLTYDDKIYYAVIRAKDATNRDILIDMFSTKFGKPSYSDIRYDDEGKIGMYDSGTILWSGDKLRVDLRFSFSKDESNPVTIIEYRWMPVYNKWLNRLSTDIEKTNKEKKIKVSKEID